MEQQSIPEESLKKKTVVGVGWSAVDNIVQTGGAFAVSIVLARLLTPDDYGLIGIILIFTNVCTALINGGFTTALIRKKDATDDDYNTVFIVNIGASLILYAIIYFSSPLIASFFSREELIDLTRVCSLGMIIGSLSLVQQTQLVKKIDFKSQAKITFVAVVSGGIIGISLALMGFGVWALVAQQLIFHLLRTILLWGVNKWIPNLHFSKESFYDLFGFGWKMMVSSVLETIWKELYQVVVGKFYSPASLGQYTRSKQFSKLLSQTLTTVIQRVTYPVLSNIQDDKSRMVEAYRLLIKTTMFVTAIGMFFLGAISEPLIFTLIGPKWHEAAIYLPLICIAGSAYPLHALNLNMLQVQGRSDLFLGLEVVKKIIAVGPLMIGVFIGIMPMLYTNIVTTIIAFFLNSHYSGQFLGYNSWMQLHDVAPSYGIGLLVALLVFPLKFLPLSSWIILLIQIFLGVAVILLACKILKRAELNTIIALVFPSK